MFDLEFTIACTNGFIHFICRTKPTTLQQGNVCPIMVKALVVVAI